MPKNTRAPKAHQGGTAGDDVARRWLSVEDSSGDTWMFDLTFLTSNWTCIFGNGCQGVLEEPTPELVQGCCSHGAYFSDDDDRERVEAHATLLGPDDWQHIDLLEEFGTPLVQDADGDWATRTIESGCIFLNRPDFEGGPGCALHVAAQRRGERPLDWKPDVCWQLPLRLNEDTDENNHTTFRLGDWHRRDWGAGGNDFHWWCTDTPDAFVGKKPVYVELEDEIRALIGDEQYELLRRHVTTHTPVPVELSASKPKKSTKSKKKTAQKQSPKMKTKA